MSTLFTFVNSYLSDIQRGIQSLHVAVDLATEYDTDSKAGRVFWGWAWSDKTVVVLNGGNSKSLLEIHELFATGNHDFPYTYFKEDDASLNGALTAVGIVVPGYLSSFKVREEHKNNPDITIFERRLIELLDNSNLA